jgi:hypothetical protein
MQQMVQDTVSHSSAVQGIIVCNGSDSGDVIPQRSLECDLVFMGKTSALHQYSPKVTTSQ